MSLSAALFTVNFTLCHQVEPLLEVIVGKTLEQAIMELMEEQELAALQAHQVPASFPSAESHPLTSLAPPPPPPPAGCTPPATPMLRTPLQARPVDFRLTSLLCPPPPALRPAGPL